MPGGCFRTSLAEATGGQLLRLAPSSRDRINPLDLVLPDAEDVADAGGAPGQVVGARWRPAHLPDGLDLARTGRAQAGPR